MDSSPRQTLAISDAADLAGARDLARTLARSVGFNAQATEEIVLAVSELGSNLVKHAQRGSLNLQAIADGARTGLQVEAVDAGPGIADIDQALTDGFSTAGSLGCGLGAVNRLMDQLDIDSQVGRGTRVVCRRWLRQHQESHQPCPLSVGVATRALLPLEGNGDAFVIKRWNESLLITLIDGLGHGKFAQRAAQTARQYVEAHFDQPLVDIFLGVGRACRATRGVVMAAARFDWGNGKLLFGSIGNVETRTIGPARSLSFLVRRGVLGLNAPMPKVTEHEWDPAHVMILHTDGLKSHWRWQDYPELAKASATLVAQQLLRALAKDHDDATVVVVRGDLP